MTDPNRKPYGRSPHQSSGQPQRPTWSERNNPYARRQYHGSSYNTGYNGSHRPNPGYSPYYGQQQYYSNPNGPYQQPNRGNGRFPTALVIVVIVIALVVGVMVFVKNSKSTSGSDDRNMIVEAKTQSGRKSYSDKKDKTSNDHDDSSKTDGLSESVINDPNRTIVKDQKTYMFSDAQNYQKYKDAVITAYNKWSNPDYAIKYLPHNKSSIDYYSTWLYILSDKKAAFNFGDVRQTTDLNDAEAYYAGKIDELNQLEQKFMKNQDLNVTVDITRSDGTRFTSDGKAPDQSDPITPGKTSDSNGLGATEAKIKSGTYAKSADGTYLKAGEQLAADTGLAVDYNFSDMNSHCTRMSNIDYVVAAFCSNSPSLVYVNMDHKNYSNVIRSEDYVDTMKHELSHYFIYKRCGTTRPPMGVETEAITNSYAVKYLGADANRMRKFNEGFPQYYMSQASDAAADKIHSGQCTAN